MILDRQLKAMIGIMATIALFWSLSAASAVFAPVALALFIIALVWPWQEYLQTRMPKLLALAVCILATVVVFLTLMSLVIWAFGRVGRGMMTDAGQFQAFYDQATTWLESHGLSVTGMWTEHFNASWILRILQQITGRLNTTLSFWLIALVYVILGLLEVDVMRRKVQTLSNREAARILIDGTALTAAKFRRYMLVRTQMSILTGLFVWLLATAFGLPFATEWGVIAFVLNYIPFIGPFIATVFPTLFAIVQLGTWQAVAGVFICLNIVQFVIGSYIEPRVSGNALSMSPLIVLFSVFFWTFLWGFFGAFIGVPITIAVLTFAAQHPSSYWLAHLLGGNPPEAANPGEAR